MLNNNSKTPPLVFCLVVSGVCYSGCENALKADKNSVERPINMYPYLRPPVAETYSTTPTSYWHM